MMSASEHKITPADIAPLNVYAAERAERLRCFGAAPRQPAP